MEPFQYRNTGPDNDEGNLLYFAPHTRVLDRLRRERRNDILKGIGTFAAGEVAVPVLIDVLATLTGNWWAIPLLHLIAHVSPIVGGGVAGWHFGSAVSTQMDIRAEKRRWGRRR